MVWYIFVRDDCPIHHMQDDNSTPCHLLRSLCNCPSTMRLSVPLFMLSLWQLPECLKCAPITHRLHHNHPSSSFIIIVVSRSAYSSSSIPTVLHMQHQGRAAKTVELYASLIVSFNRDSLRPPGPSAPCTRMVGVKGKYVETLDQWFLDLEIIASLYHIVICCYFCQVKN